MPRQSQRHIYQEIRKELSFNSNPSEQSGEIVRDGVTGTYRTVNPGQVEWAVVRGADRVTSNGISQSVYLAIAAIAGVMAAMCTE